MKKLISILLLALISPMYAKIYNSLLIRDYLQVGSLILESDGSFTFLNVIGNANIGGSLNVQGSLTINGAPISSSGGSGVVGLSSPTTAGAVVLFSNTTGNGIEQSANNPVSGSPVTIDSSANLSNVNNLTVTGDLIIPTTNSTFSQGALIQNSMPILHTYGNMNTAVGANALASSPLGAVSNSTAFGNNALASLTSGTGNTGIGFNVMRLQTGGSSNTIVGYNALESITGTANNNTAIGALTLSSLTTSSNNIALGFGAGGSLTTGSNNIYIGIDPGIGTQSNTTYISGIYGTTTGSATTQQVLVDINNQLGTTASSARYKKNISSMESVITALMKLRPVRFRYNVHDDQTVPEYGLIAEEVAQVLPDLVIYNDDQPETVKYHVLPAILLKAIQELDSQNNELQMIIEQLIHRIAVLERAA